MAETTKLHVDLGITIPELVGSILGLVPKILAAWSNDHKITVAEVRDLVAWFLSNLAEKANPDAAEFLRFLAEAIDIDP